MRATRLLLAVALASLACTSETPPPPSPPVSKPPSPPPKVVGTSLPVNPPTASESGRTDPECVGIYSVQGEESQFKIGAHAFRRTGAVMTATDLTPGEHGDVFGVIANLKEPTPENLFNLKRYVDFFKEQKVEAILVAGDSGETKDEIRGSLELLVKSGLPVLVIPGNREAKVDFHAAITELASTSPNVIDMSRIRLVKFQAASIISLPGYYDKRFMHTGEAGCLYTKEDVYRLEPIMKAAVGSVVLLAHAEPHGQGREAIDAFQGGNAGDANLTDFIRTRGVPFGIFANIQEAGGHATDLDSNTIREGDAKDHLYLNPGLADSTDWQLNDGTSSHGMVAVLTIKDGKGSYKSYRAPMLSAADEAAARNLVKVPGAAAH